MRSKTILLVEDDPNDLALTLRAFEKNRLANQLTVVRDGAEALEYLFASADGVDRDLVLPQVVLLDLKLPRVPGLDVLRRIRGDERTRRLPVVILTSSTEEKDIVSSYDLGANSFVRKPVDFMEFTEAARQLGLYWLVLNESAPSR
jgi:two-component system response regulator